MIWIAVFPTLTVLNLTLTPAPAGPARSSAGPSSWPRVAVPIVIYGAHAAAAPGPRPAACSTSPLSRCRTFLHAETLPASPAPQSTTCEYGSEHPVHLRPISGAATGPSEARVTGDTARLQPSFWRRSRDPSPRPRARPQHSQTHRAGPPGSGAFIDDRAAAEPIRHDDPQELPMERLARLVMHHRRIVSAFWLLMFVGGLLSAGQLGRQVGVRLLAARSAGRPGRAAGDRHLRRQPRRHLRRAGHRAARARRSRRSATRSTGCSPRRWRRSRT